MLNKMQIFNLIKGEVFRDREQTQYTEKYLPDFMNEKLINLIHGELTHQGTIERWASNKFTAKTRKRRS